MVDVRIRWSISSLREIGGILSVVLLNLLHLMMFPRLLLFSPAGDLSSFLLNSMLSNSECGVRSSDSSVGLRLGRNTSHLVDLVLAQILSSLSNAVAKIFGFLSLGRSVSHHSGFSHWTSNFLLFRLLGLFGRFDDVVERHAHLLISSNGERNVSHLVVSHYVDL